MLALTKSTPVAAILALVEAGRGKLHLLSVPTAGFGADLLAAADALGAIEAGATVVPGFGLPPRLRSGVSRGAIREIPSSCPLIEMQLVAGAMGLRFTEVPGIEGSALAHDRDDFRVIESPFHAGEKMILAPALNPDAAIIHGSRADHYGNVVASIHTEDRLVARASRYVIATVERVATDALDSLSPEEEVIPALLIDRVCLAPKGASPWACAGVYAENPALLRRWFSGTDADGKEALTALTAEVVRA